MPGGSKGEKRPADVIGSAVTVMRVATLVWKVKERGRTARWAVK